MTHKDNNRVYILTQQAYVRIAKRITRRTVELGTPECWSCSKPLNVGDSVHTHTVGPKRRLRHEACARRFGLLI